MCERHFNGEDIEYTATGIEGLKLQALPSLNFPEKLLERRQLKRKLEEHCSETMTTQNSAKS